MKKLFLVLLFLPQFILASPVPTFWSDSYTVGGISYCDSTFDHGIDTTVWPTPCGDKTVPQICSEITQVFGVGATTGRTYYNTIQSGHPPLNNVADETDCPGIPQNTTGTWSGPRCQETGALWPLDGLCQALEPISCGASIWQFWKHCPNKKPFFENPIPDLITAFALSSIGVVIVLGWVWFVSIRRVE